VLLENESLIREKKIGSNIQHVSDFDRFFDIKYAILVDIDRMLVESDQHSLTSWSCRVITSETD
jgi:hypothetical protein